PEAIVQAGERREGLSVGAGGRWLLWKGGNDGPAEITVKTDSGGRRNCTFSVASFSKEHTAIGGKVSEQNAAGQTTESEIAVGFYVKRGSGGSGFSKPLDDVPEVRFLDPRAGGLQTPLHQLYTRVVEQGLHHAAITSIRALIPSVEDIQILAPE